MKRKFLVAAHLPESMEKRVKLLAIIKNRSVAEVLREILQEYFRLK